MEMEEETSDANVTVLFEHDYTQRAAVASVILLISAVGVAGNTLVIAAVLLSTKLRTATNAFVVNLAAADLLTCAVLPVDAAALLGRADPPLNVWACKVVAVVLFTTVGCSIFNLASIGVNRLLLITRPTTTYRRLYTRGRIAAWLLLNWLVPLSVSLAPPLAGVGEVGYNARFHFCGSISSHPLYTTYNLILALALYPIPMVAIVTSYALIWLHLRRHAQKLTANTRPPAPAAAAAAASSADGPVEKYTPRDFFTVCGSTEALAAAAPAPPAPRQRAAAPPAAKNRQMEVTKNMVYVVCGFGLCLTPYAVNLTFDANGPGILYTTAILLLNNCINPFIYATKHRDFKVVFACILRCRWRLVPDPSDFLKALTR